MADSQKGKKMRKFIKQLCGLLALAIFYLIVILYRQYYQSEITNTEPQNTLKVHMIDCGQGDCFLFEYQGEFAMIDCGPKSAQERVVNYLKGRHVDKFKFIVGTHYHSDHIAALTEVLNNFETDVLYLPKTKGDPTTTDWYVKLKKKIKSSAINVVNPNVSDVFYLGDVTFTVVGQFSYKQAGTNPNNYSPVIKVTYGNMDIIMTGDAEKKVEKEILKSGVNLEAEVIKLGHHGSDTSTSINFLEAVNPKYALISCGLDNDYGHPCESTMENLKKRDIKVYRTDQEGDVIMTVTPTSISFDKSNGDYRCGIIPESERMKNDEDND